MRITVVFNDTAGTNLPEDAALVFEHVTSYQVQTPADVERVGCAEDGCPGCGAVHRRFTGATHLLLEAHGTRQGGPCWHLPPEVT